MTHPITDNSHLHYADKETKELFDAHALVEKADDILRQIEYADVRSAQDAINEALAEIVFAEKHLIEDIRDYEGKAA